MPSIATITSFYNFTALTVIRSAQVNTNFDTFRGHIIAVDPSTATSAATMTYDLGSNDHAWRNIYAKGLHIYGDTVGATPPSGYYNIYVKSTDGKAYKKDSAGVESQLGGGALVASGTPSAPNTITAAGGVSYTTSDGERQIKYLVGDTITGTDITANPQIAASTSTSVNLELYLYGTDNDKAITFDDGNGLSLPGSRTLYNGSVLGLLWNGSLWTELFYKV